MRRPGTDTPEAPLFSIVTVCRNAERSIDRAIDSVLGQRSFAGAWEHIVIDGASTDGTLDVLARYEHLHVLSEPDSGIYHAMNKGAALARGTYVGFLNADDWYEPDTLASVAAALCHSPPIEEAWSLCAKRASHDPLWTLAPRVALGASDGRVQINVAGNSVSSSILPMRDSHRMAAPASTYVRTETVDLRRLDDIARAAVDVARHPFLKVDTQGYEREVLTGATGILDRLVGIQLEMSLMPLYDGSPTLIELLQTMARWGFEPFAMLPAFSDVTSGRMLQVDGLFLRSEGAVGHRGASEV